MTSQKICRIILIRHGETEWNRIKRFRGRADVPLNETGLRQAAATGIRVARQWQPSAIYSSPLSRAAKTAEAIARHFNLPVQVCPGLNDIDFGDWQGLTAEEVQLRWPAELNAWRFSPHLAEIPAGETLAKLRRRAIDTNHDLITRHYGETIVLVGHTAINRIILLAVLGLGNERFWHIHQDNCAVNVFEVQDEKYFLVSLNDTCHLQDK